MNPRGDAGGPITVGICEDDLEFVEILKTNVFTLENGFEVVFTHGSAFEFIESIPIGVVMTRESAREYMPDLLVIDVMPQGTHSTSYSRPDGVTSMAHVRQVGLTSPILVISSLADSIIEELLRDANLEDASYIRKSATLTPRKILEAARRAVGRG